MSDDSDDEEAFLLALESLDLGDTELVMF